MGNWGGRRKGAGPRKKPVSPDVCRRVLEKIGEEAEWLAQYAKAKTSKSTGEAVRILTMLRRFGYGDPAVTVNHLHDKPIDLNVTLSLGERMRTSMERANERVSKR